MSLNAEEKEKLFAALKQLFGTTEMCPRVGWVLPDGSKLDLGDITDKEEIQRRIDHTVAIAEGFKRAAGYYPDYPAMRLGQEAGILRTHFQAPGPTPWGTVYHRGAFLQFTNQPTESQVRAIEDCVCQVEPESIEIEKVVPLEPGKWSVWASKNAEVGGIERGCRVAMRDVRHELKQMEED